VLAAAIYAFKEKGMRSAWAKRPYWFRFPTVAKLAGCSWSTDESPDGVQIVTRPNNPDNYTQILTRRMLKNTITDCCYNWPQYTDKIHKTDQVVSIFSLAKMTGHAASRVGWAIVKDQGIADLMTYYIEQSTGGASVDAQVRAAHVIAYEITNVQNDVPSVFSWGAEEMRGRWTALEASLPVEIEVLNINDKGMFAWCKLKSGGNAASYMMGRYGIKVMPGTACGSTPDRFRVNMGSTEEEFVGFVSRLLTE
jgi:aspartate/methionine/tyrosine aminotransferase